MQALALNLGLLADCCLNRSNDINQGSPGSEQEGTWEKREMQRAATETPWELNPIHNA